MTRTLLVAMASLGAAIWAFAAIGLLFVLGAI